MRKSLILLTILIVILSLGILGIAYFMHMNLSTYLLILGIAFIFVGGFNFLDGLSSSRTDYSYVYMRVEGQDDVKQELKARNHSILFLIVMAAIGSLLIFVSTISSKQIENNGMKRVNFTIASRRYDSMGSLCKNSSIIVTAKAVKNLDTLKTTFKTIDPKEQVYTPVFIEITEIIKGSDKQMAGNTVILNQPGGRYENVQYYERNTSFLKVGSSYVLFLNEEGNGNYSLMSPGEGMLEIINDSAVSGPGSGLFPYNEPIPLTKLKDMIKSELNKTYPPQF